jgi:hypothetical protein
MAFGARMADKGKQAWSWLERDLPPSTGRFADPGRGDAWWWLGVPLFVAVTAPVIYAIDRDFYNEAINQEGWGLLELAHVVVPLAALVLAIALLRDPLVWRSRFLRVWIGVAALGSLYIAGEEASWGQHFWGWETPERWAELNRQSETNLHNISSWLDRKPRLLMQLGMIVGGIVLPLALPRLPWLKSSPAKLIVPPLALMPTAVLALVYYVVRDFQPVMPDARFMVTRPSEVEETFMVLFVLFYLIVFRRRIAQLRPAAAQQPVRDTAEAS